MGTIRRGLFNHVIVLGERLLLRLGRDYVRNIAFDGKCVRMRVTLDGLHDAQFTNTQKAGFESRLTKLDARYG